MATADPDQSPSTDDTSADDTSADDTSADDIEAPKATASADDDLRLRYREALERKRAGGSAAATGHGADRPNAPTSNDKVKRTFRRRAGG